MSGEPFKRRETRFNSCLSLHSKSARTQQCENGSVIFFEKEANNLLAFFVDDRIIEKQEYDVILKMRTTW